MRTWLAGLAAVAGLASPVVGQTPADTTRSKLLVVKITPLSVVDPHGTVALGVEYFLPDDYSVQLEGGYGWFSEHYLSNNGQDLARLRVLRVRAEGRLYLPERQSAWARHYVAGEVMFKHVIYPITQLLGRECVDGDCAYFEQVSYQVKKVVGAYHLKIGWQKFQRNRLVFDYFAGLGFRHISVWRENFPEHTGKAFNPNDADTDATVMATDILEPGFYFRPSLTLNFKLGWLFYRPVAK